MTAATGRGPEERDQRPSQQLRAQLGLRELILAGEFEPGERVSELPLVERLGVSRTPLRLALTALAHEGLLEAHATSGFVVRSFTFTEVIDAIELRGLLEGNAARLAAERGPRPADVQRAHELVTELDEIVRLGGLEFDDFLAYVDRNEAFHALLLDMARSSVLRRALEHAAALPFASPSAFVHTEAELPESHRVLVVAQEHHRAIVEAIERGEGARAEQLGREHARIARRNLELALTDERLRASVPGGSLILMPDTQEVGKARDSPSPPDRPRPPVAWGGTPHAPTDQGGRHVTR
ncbi:GntR family transcriptional regulator [Egibacter rhizosphaerae]|uniref:GntR family transcriptional regulator n=1 Tax=Egibacter rhizosphaerae TaxID=1670831 RepID=A0A411YI85_9ACTN|nr:GntR family transcriptional regulator [Egibacter rhizosphaerae]QBI21004.1 GntR family transcriptional regulator [Egibacter rhizosphaerae]